MLGPLARGGGIVGADRADLPARPAALTSVMMAAFAAKLVFFGGYVAVMLRVSGAAAGSVRGQLHQLFHRAVSVEALYLKRLFAV